MSYLNVKNRAASTLAANLTYPADWVASTAYALADYVTPTTKNGYRYECTTAGTSDATEPTWGTIIGGTTTDGTATWTCRGLSADLTAGEGALFPASNFHITIEDEILLCTTRSTDTLTLAGGKEGTTPVAHATASVVELRITAGIIQNLERGCGQINVETLAANKTLTPGTDKIYQYLKEGGADRIITLDTASASVGDRFVIRHNGLYNNSNYLQIQQAASVLDKIYASGIKEFIFDGTNWISGENGTGQNAEIDKNIALGQAAIAYNGGVGIGYKSNGLDNGVGVGQSANGWGGVAIGKGSNAYNEGVAIGIDTYSNNDGGVSIGHKATTNSKKYSVALGYLSKTQRHSEIAHNINGVDTDQENNITIIGLEKQTANNTPIEMLCGGQAGQRITIHPISVLTFTILVTARDNVSGDCAAYKVEGAIKRDAAGNTVMLAAAVVSVIHEDDVSWDVAVAADDVNEALVITVTGDATNITQWAARLDGVETRF